LIAQAFGGTIGYMRKLRPGEKDPRPSYHPGQFKEWGFYPVRIIKPDPLFDGLGTDEQPDGRRLLQNFFIIAGVRPPK
ncbi:MAG: hypothetical protein N3B01_11955, partial [Verrucomicrobiae bacterium]|nr:hypothetical protein [Verrucomicrobiae bacterium]